MSIENLLANALDQDALAFEKTFNQVMTDKVTDAIQTKYDEMYPSTPATEEDQ